MESVAQSDRDRFQNQSQASDAARLRRGKSNTDSGRTFSRAQSKRAGWNQSASKIGFGGSRSQHPGRVRRYSDTRSDKRGGGGRFVHRKVMDRGGDGRRKR